MHYFGADKQQGIKHPATESHDQHRLRHLPASAGVQGYGLLVAKSKGCTSVLGETTLLALDFLAIPLRRV
jgi:hypothetical protein